MSRLIECVPNFSEGRDQETVLSLIETIRSIPGVSVLDSTMDPDHNRSVITFVGEPEATAEAAFQVVSRASQLIDLARHEGVHPRIGAVDVLPFVPLADATMQVCVEIARTVGRRIGENLAIPVYLYEKAATRPERVHLEEIRRGGIERLREGLGKDPALTPDFGPSLLHPTAGAVVVGARDLLVAFNINLATRDLSVAREIAKGIRHSNGGFRYVKALGLPLTSRGIVQVSINLTNFRETPIHRVYEVVKREAERHGTQIIGCEVIGLIPREALIGSAEFYLQLSGFTPEKILENRLASFDRASGPREVVGMISTPRPTPGGGSVAALSGALSAALGSKICGLVPHIPPDRKEVISDLSHRLTRAFWEDADAYGAVISALALPDGEIKKERVEKALQTATDLPLMIASLSREVLKFLEDIRPLVTDQALSCEAAVAMQIARASALSALEIVRANLLVIKDKQYLEKCQTWILGIEEDIPPSP